MLHWLALWSLRDRFDWHQCLLNGGLYVNLLLLLNHLLSAHWGIALDFGARYAAPEYVELSWLVSEASSTRRGNLGRGGQGQHLLDRLHGDANKFLSGRWLYRHGVPLRVQGLLCVGHDHVLHVGDDLDGLPPLWPLLRVPLDLYLAIHRLLNQIQCYVWLQDLLH